MRITNSEKLKMVLEHVSDGKSLSHISERYGNYDTSRIKYYVNLYKKYGEKSFINRKDGVYKRDTKLLMINRVKHGESIRSVALDFGLIDPRILGDWVTLYKESGEDRIQDTYPRKSHLNKDERYKANIVKH